MATPGSELKLDELLFAHRAIRGYQISVRTVSGASYDAAAGSTTGERPMTCSTLHHVWCGAKPLLAIVAVDAHGRGLIDLSRTCGTFAATLPGLAGNKATLWDVLCHDAGLAAPVAFDLWTAPLADRRALLSSMRYSDQSMAAYSELAGWALLARVLDETSDGALADLIVSMLARLSINPDEFLVDGPALVPEVVGERIGVYYASSDDGRPAVPLLHDLIPHLIHSISPAFGALVSARALAELYHGMSTAPSLSDAVSAMIAYRRGVEHDSVLDRECDFAAGLMIGLNDHGFGHRQGARSFGHSGWLGSSWGFADPDVGLAVGFTHNGFLESTINDKIRNEVVERAYEQFA